MEVIITALFIYLILLLLWFAFSPKKWKHDQVGWGYPTEKIYPSDLPGASGEAICHFCGKRIIKDRGGWYHSTLQDNK